MLTWLPITQFGEHLLTVNNMATYADIRKFIKLALDIDPAVTNDQTTDLIDFHIQRVLNDLLVLVRPMEVFVESSPVSVTSATTSIAQGVGGFGVTDLFSVHGISVDQEFAITGERKDYMWTPVSYTQWIGRDFEEEQGKWTVDPSADYYLSQWPADGETWKVYLWYYKQPAAITDLGVPEIPQEYHLSTIVPGVILGFPHRFTGSRQELLVMYSKMYTDGIAAMMRNRKVKSLKNLFRPIGAGRVGQANVLPDWQTS